jgi:pimeloyl-ACP methyl ester carboxylesterase
MARHHAIDHWVQHPGGRIFARQWVPEPTAGAGVPIVLLHDSLGCVELWRDFPSALSERTGRRVIAYDRWGFGRSDPRVDRPSIDFIAEEAREHFPSLREQLELDRFVALGHSVGGAMALEIGAAMPDACEAVITIAAQVFAEDRTLEGIRAAKDNFAQPAQLQRLVRYHGTRAPWVLDAWTHVWLDPEFSRWTLASVLPRIECPVLAIHGDQDEFGSVAHPHLTQRLVPRAEIHLLPGIGHVPQRENAGLILSLIEKFLGSRPLTA